MYARWPQCTCASVHFQCSWQAGRWGAMDVCKDGPSVPVPVYIFNVAGKLVAGAQTPVCMAGAPLPPLGWFQHA